MQNLRLACLATFCSHKKQDRTHPATKPSELINHSTMPSSKGHAVACKHSTLQNPCVSNRGSSDNVWWKRQTAATALSALHMAECRSASKQSLPGSWSARRSAALLTKLAATRSLTAQLGGMMVLKATNKKLGESKWVKVLKVIV